VVLAGEQTPRRLALHRRIVHQVLFASAVVLVFLGWVVMQ
jgi:hypothetical protein